jgi:hypothetical protein
MGTSAPQALRQSNPWDSKREDAAEEIPASVRYQSQSVNRFPHRRKPNVQ